MANMALGIWFILFGVSGYVGLPPVVLAVLAFITGILVLVNR